MSKEKQKVDPAVQSAAEESLRAYATQLLGTIGERAQEYLQPDAKLYVANNRRRYIRGLREEAIDPKVGNIRKLASRLDLDLSSMVVEAITPIRDSCLELAKQVAAKGEDFTPFLNEAHQLTVEYLTASDKQGG